MKTPFPVLVTTLVLLVAGLASGTSAAVTEQQIDAAIERGIAYLWTLQRDDGRFKHPRDGEGHLGHTYVGEQHIMAMLAVAYGGERLTRPEMKKGLKVLLDLKLEQTYTISFRVITVARLYHGADKATQSALRKALKGDVARLADMQHTNGGWYYTKEARWDFSNTQIAVLALREASLCGVEVNRSVMQKVQELYLKSVRGDGGWNYGGHAPDRPSYGSMTAAAVASLFITRDFLNPGRGCPCKGGRSTGRRDRQMESAINGGIKWLDKYFTTESNPNNPTFVGQYVYYWLYCCERVGIATGMKYFGTHDWYAAGAEAIIKGQTADGSWGRVYRTSLALLFLIKGRAPILMNKLQFDGRWNQHSRDVANLARHIGLAKEQQFNWQIVNLSVPVTEMHDAPILYISTESSTKLSDEHKRTLREFTDTGGTVLFEASCGNKAAAQWCKTTCRQVWPEWELKGVDKEHALWTADIQIKGRRPVLQGISDGLRTLVFYSPRDISCAWNTNAVARNRITFSLGTNLYAYATDRGKLRVRLAAHAGGTQKKYADQKLARGARAVVTVARIKHGGHWQLGRHYRPWELLSADLQEKVGLTVRETEPAAPGRPVAEGTSLLYLSGRATCDLNNNDGVAWLKQYLTRGGFLLAEATLGDERFDGPAKKLLEKAGLTLKPLAADSPLLAGGFAGARGYHVGKVEFTSTLREQRIGKTLPLLFGLYEGEKLVGVYSPFDLLFSQTGLVAWGNRGYAAADARAIASNIMLMLSGR